MTHHANLFPHFLELLQMRHLKIHCQYFDLYKLNIRTDQLNYRLSKFIFILRFPLRSILGWGDSKYDYRQFFGGCS
jgi:hypothetical protein